jgi:hypothetical protein
MRRRDDEWLSFSATEVGNFLACPHLTSLELQVAEGLLERPAQNDIERRLLEKRGFDEGSTTGDPGAYVIERAFVEK